MKDNYDNYPDNKSDEYREYLRKEFPPSKCPSCDKYSVIPYIRGLPSPEMGDAEALGLVILGGCVVSPLDPKAVCTSCDWVERIDIDEIYDESPLGMES